MRTRKVIEVTFSFHRGDADLRLDFFNTDAWGNKQPLCVRAAPNGITRSGDGRTGRTDIERLVGILPAYYPKFPVSDSAELSALLAREFPECAVES